MPQILGEAGFSGARVEDLNRDVIATVAVFSGALVEILIAMSLAFYLRNRAGTGR